MTDNISFCPVCAGKLEPAGPSDLDRYVCEDCETEFLIQAAEKEKDEEDEEDDEDY